MHNEIKEKREWEEEKKNERGGGREWEQENILSRFGSILQNGKVKKHRGINANSSSTSGWTNFRVYGRHAINLKIIKILPFIIFKIYENSNQWRTCIILIVTNTKM